MTVLLDRWQFGVTITYHFLFVPLTIGLAFLVAIMQVLAYRRKDAVRERLTRFFGTLFLINFAMGIVTGIVQEFQFGMNWSNYSVFVGNIFGAPLAMEGLLAFFAESTFIGLWLFGRNRLPPLVHTLSICVVSLGTMVSAFFILTANAWMQHPVGYRIVGNKAELTDFWAVLRNSTLWAEFSHTVLAAFVTGSMVVLGVSGWQLLRGGNAAAFTRSAKLSAWVALVCTVLVMVTGDIQARLMDTQQPMKMAAAEAVYRTQNGASFSLLTIGNLSGQPIFQIRIPHLLSLIATLSWNGKVTASPGPAGRGAALRAGQLRAGPVGHVLELPPDGRARVPDADRVRMGAVAVQARSSEGLRARALDPLGAGGLHRHPVPGEHVRLAVHRDGTPALDRIRPDENRGGDLAQRLGHRRGHHPGRFRLALHRARSHRRGSHVPGRPARTGHGGRTTSAWAAGRPG